ncbi:hypothetical protein PINS_up010340 [Pythium insidiosum]|nr:hypothetical protein PINS_up010340 [Pythium insidiosum]
MNDHLRHERTLLLPRSPGGLSLSSSLESGVSCVHVSHTMRRDVWSVLRYRAATPQRASLQRVSRAVEAGMLVLILLNVLLAMRQADVKSPLQVSSGMYSAFT